MSRYVILTNGKRAVVALAHSVAFLVIATFGAATTVHPLRAGAPPSTWFLAAIYLVVSSVLLALTAISGKGMERSYFAFCATSAGFGFLRQLFGDPRLYVAVYIRSAMLLCAVATGVLILRGYRTTGWPSRPADASPHRCRTSPPDRPQ